MSAYLDAMRRYATFSSRSTRKEFWYYHLVLLGLAISGLIIDVAIAGPREPQPLVSALIVMGHYVPSLAVIVRRLHDLEKNGWLVLTCLIPLVGIVAFIVIGSTPSKPGAMDFPGSRDQRPPPPLPPSGSNQQIERIEKLAALHSSGAITAEEFETMKAGIIGIGQLGREHRTAPSHMEKSVMTKNRGILLAALSLSAAIVASTYMPAVAGEHSYHKGNSWQVVLKTPDPFGDEAFCGFRSTAWSGKSVAIEYTLIGIDKIVPRLRVTKQNWNLPAGQTTNVSIGTEWAGNIQFVSKVVNGDELYGEIPETVAEDGGGFKVTTILGTAISTNKPAPLAITFQGNEPPWLVPVMTYTEAVALGTGFDTCISTLTGLGPSLFKAPQASSTSPFAQPSGGGGAGTAAQAPANRSVMPQNPPPKSAAATTASTSPWVFEQREEDWGDTCFVEAKQGDVTVGFMGSPGKDFVAFVENGNFDGIVRASWQVDDKAAQMSNGHLEDYFGWYGFYELSPQILDEGKKGKKLEIADLDGKTIAVSLADAATPFSQFQACFDKAAPKTKKASNYPAAEQTPPNRKGCVLEVDGTKAIDGACYWGPYGSMDGSFVMEANGFFALIGIDTTGANGAWNKTPGSTHAHSDLGEMKRDGKCWKNRSVRVCAGNE